MGWATLRALGTRQGVLALLLLIGCARGMKPEVPTQAPEAVLEMARARPILDPVQGKYSFKIRSRVLDVAGSTNGVVILDRPGKGHVAILGPLGGPIFTLSSDGVGVSVVLPRERRQLLALDAAAVLEEVAPGLAELDDLFGLLVGDIPFEEARIRETRALDEGRMQVILDGPNDTVVLVTLRTTTATPEAVVVQRATPDGGDGVEQLLAASFGEFDEVDGARMPAAVAVEVPALDLRVDLNYRSWKPLDTVPPVFGLEAPEGFTEESLERALEEMAAGLAEEAAAAE